MGRFNPAPFSPHHSFVVVKPFTYASVAYAHGDRFPTDGVSPHRLRQMFDARMIGPKGFGEEPPRYLNNGLGKADKLRAEIEREEAEAAKNSPKGEGDAQPQPDAKPAAPQRARAAKPSAAVGKKPAQRVGSSKPAAKSAPKRASARSR